MFSEPDSSDVSLALQLNSAGGHSACPWHSPKAGQGHSCCALEPALPSAGGRWISGASKRQEKRPGP